MTKMRTALVFLVVVALAASGTYAAQGFVPYSGGTVNSTTNPGNFNFNSLPTTSADVNASTAPVINSVTYTLTSFGKNQFSLSDTTIGTGGTAIASGLDGWWSEATVADQLGAQAGLQTKGGLISFGATSSTTRALGLLATSTSGNTTFAVAIKNTTSSTTYNSFSLSFTYQLWRQAGTANPLLFTYFVDTTNSTPIYPTTGTAVAALNSSFATGTATASDLTAPVNTSSPSVTNQAISNWGPGQYLWLVWTCTSASGAQGTAIVGLTFSAASVIPPANVTWNVAGSGTWDTTSPNWVGGNPVANLYKDTDNATFNNAAGGTITVQAGGVLPGSTLASASAGTYTFSGGSIGGSGSFTKSGAGTAVLSASNAYSGGTSVTGGVLQISNDSQLGAASGTLSVDTGGTLTLTGAVTGARNLTFGSAGATVATGGNNFSTSGTSAINGTLSTTGSGNVALNGAVTFTAPGALNIGVGGSVTLGQSSGTVSQQSGGTYNGNLVVTNGGARLNFDVATVSGSGQINVQSTGLLMSNTSQAAAGTVNVAIALNSGNVSFTKGDVTQATYVPGTFVTTMGGTKLSAGNDNLLTFGGIISGNSDVNFANNVSTGGGSGIALLGAANTYTGVSAFNMGNASIQLGVNNALPTGTDVIFGTLSGVTTPILDLNGHSQQINSLSHGANGTPGNFKITNGGGADATLTISGSTTPANPFGGVIADGSTNKVALVKSGTGTLTLSGASTYTGATTVNGGTLSLATSGSLISNVTINGNVGGSGALRGTGTVAGSVSTSDVVNQNARVWPGVAASVGALSANETLTVASVSLASGGKLAAIVRHNSGSPVNQKLSVTGSFTIDATSVLSLAYETGTYADAFSILKAGTPPGDMPAFTKVLPLGTAGVAYDLVYKKANSVVATNPVLGSTITGGYDELVVQFKNTAVTPVTLADFSARAEGAGVALEWTSVSEFQNAGFNVYRRNSKFKIQNSKLTNSWQRVNANLIAGRITSADAKAYRLYDWVEPGIWEYRLESVSVRGVKEDYRETVRAVVDEAAVDGVSQDFASALGEARHWQGQWHTNGEQADGGSLRESERLNLRRDGDAKEPWYAKYFGNPVLVQGSEVLPSFAPRASVREINPDSPGDLRGPQAHPHISARWFTAQSAGVGAGSFTAAKVVYGDGGVLLIPQANLPAGFDPRHVALLREGRALTALALNANGLLIYGPGYQDDYTNEDAIFLRAIAGPTAAGAVLHAQGLFDANVTAAASAPASVTAAYHDVYFDYNYRPFTFAPWFSNQYLTDGSDQIFTLATPRAVGGPASLIVNLWTVNQVGAAVGDGAAPNHALNLMINSMAAGSAQWSGGDAMMQLSFQLPDGILNDGANQIELITPDLGGTQLSFVHSMTLSYSRALALDGSKPLTIVNASSTSKLYEVSGLPTSNAWVVDARFADRAALAAYEAQAQADGTYTIRFNAASGGTGQFLVVPAGRENAPISVTKVSVKPIKAGNYLAVGPSQFSAGVQPLLALHAKEGLRAAFVDQDQLFNYYNYGRYGPAGIQNAVRAVRPKYLLLLGRTTYDYNNYSGANVDPLCPTFLVPTTFWAQATSDSLFGDLGRSVPEVAVGRLPVNNATELSMAVQRVTSYSGAPVSGVRAHAVADRADPEAGDFAAESDALAQSNPEMTWQKNYLGVTYATSPEVTSAMAQAANGGADWIVYVGHGNAVRLGNEVPRILDTDTVQAWTGNAIFLQSTCTGNWMANDVQNYKSIAIQALTQPQGGISASIGTSTYMNSSYATEFMGQLMNTASSGGRWGDALMKTQTWAAARGGESGYYLDLSRTEMIFGDPAMRVFAKPAGNAKTGTQGQF
ncbi:MAG TPA: C25 family cysteine peptidase [Planctomycetota bacterium]|nr:C25 family cysteine peptidase [Planctomycetota bacterium]